MECKAILDEVAEVTSEVNTQKVLQFIHMILKARHIYFDGFGRSGLICRGFGMRLMHLGMQCAYVGDTMTPAIGQGDLLIICSGSGSSQVLNYRAHKAADCGAKIVVITGNPMSTLGRLADLTVQLLAPAKEQRTEYSVLPMGSLFEISTAVIFEKIILEIMQQTGETSESMMKRHANLE